MSSSKKTSQRTDFLGALKESSSSTSSVSASGSSSQDQSGKDGKGGGPDVEVVRDQASPPPLTATFDDGQTNTLIRSTLADVTHPVSFSNTTLSEPAKSTDRDSLSQLFEDITDAEAAAQANSQETK